MDKKVHGRIHAPTRDAKSTYDAKSNGCTGWANLAAALGRAAGIPTRVVIGYPAWGSPLQTHYVNEFYLKDYGWWRIEPQPHKELTWPLVKQSYMSVVGVVHPAQEGPEAMSEARQVQKKIPPGVPLLSMFEVQGNLTILWPPYYYLYSPYSDHSSVGMFNIELDELGRLPYIMEVARTRWTDFLAHAAAGGAQDWIDRKFNVMFSAHCLDEVEDALFVP